MSVKFAVLPGKVMYGRLSTHTLTFTHGALFTANGSMMPTSGMYGRYHARSGIIANLRKLVLYMILPPLSFVVKPSGILALVSYPAVIYIAEMSYL